MNITLTVNPNNDLEIDEAIEVLNKLKTESTTKKETIDTSMLLSYAGRIESLFIESKNALTFWKLDDIKPDVSHWDVSGKTVVAIDKGGWMVLLRYASSEGFCAMITDDRLQDEPLFTLWAVGETIRVAMDNLYEKFTKLKSIRWEVKS